MKRKKIVKTSKKVSKVFDKEIGILGFIILIIIGIIICSSINVWAKEAITYSIDTNTIIYI